jgi:hypothetical protein
MALTVMLNDQEEKLLQEVLQGDLSRLLLEISHTDHRSLREGLKMREELLEGVIAKVSGRA